MMSRLISMATGPDRLSQREVSVAMETHQLSSERGVREREGGEKRGRLRGGYELYTVTVGTHKQLLRLE